MTNRFTLNFATTALVGFGVTLVIAKILSAMPSHAATAVRQVSGAVPAKVVVELFQSQGCSSCPPANANVNAISDRVDILALSFGVTYWDRLGWTDTFARPEYTRRQENYARALGHTNVFTPQVVLNGRSDLVGGNRGELERAIAHAQQNPPQARFAIDGTNLSVTGSDSGPSDIWLVSYELQPINVAIRAGENNGKTLPHNHVVRGLVRIGTLAGSNGQFAIPAPVNRRLSRVVLVQGQNGGPIFGITELP